MPMRERCMPAARRRRFRGRCLALVGVLALAACAPSPQPPPSQPQSPSAASPPAAAPAPSTQASADRRPRFVDRTWRVVASNAVAVGTRYRFDADGTLRIEADGSTPSRGRWTYENGRLVLVEEGIAYPAEILALDERRFAIRSHNPGEPVDIEMAPADDARD